MFKGVHLLHKSTIITIIFYPRDVYKATDYKQQRKIMPKSKAINRKKLVAFVLPIIRKEKLPMSEELEKLRQNGDFGIPAKLGKKKQAE